MFTLTAQPDDHDWPSQFDQALSAYRCHQLTNTAQTVQALTHCPRCKSDWHGLPRHDSTGDLVCPGSHVEGAKAGE